MISNSKIDVFGTKRWYNKQGKRHRDDDLPAVEYANGDKVWFKNGEPHREQDKPAVELKDGYKSWWKNGKRLSPQQVEVLKRKWKAIRNGDTDFLTEELLNDL